MSTCSLGHSVIPGIESCPECGEDVRTRCSQGHGSRSGERFCEVCGEFLPHVQAGQALAVAATAPSLDYNSGSFTDFITGSDDDYASLAVPVLPVMKSVNDPLL